MTNADKIHFDDYRRQTQTKHRILTGYLRPYFDVLKSRHPRLVYIDGFAGRGCYKDAESGQEFDGSPLLALKLIAGRPDIAARVSTYFVEADKEFFGELSVRIAALREQFPDLVEPELRSGRFGDHIETILAQLQRNGTRLPPIFLFVDPCGVEDTSFSSIIRVLRAEWCELFIFFNIEGVRRILGLSEENGTSRTLVDLFGSTELVLDLKECVQSSVTSDARESVVVSRYMNAIRQASGAKYILPFRIEAESRRSTSHYLIHATKHPLGFKIMKDVMWTAGRGDEGGVGRLELLQASAGDISALMRVDLSQLRDAVIARLGRGPARVDEFYTEWVYRPTDMFTERCYRQELLKLEEQGKVIVLEPIRKPVSAG